MTTPLPIGLRRLMSRELTFGHAVIVLPALLILFAVSAQRSYRRGQIDALNGVIKYEKQTNSDGETVWVERNGAK